MDREKYMSGAELRQYLHISTRKMKYLMDCDYIPHVNTGQATHKYLVLREDAAAFKQRMENEAGFLTELTGKFSSREHCQSQPILVPTPKNCKAFQKYLTELWVDFPDALPSRQAAQLIGLLPQRVHELVRSKKLHGIKIGAVQFVAKEEFISYAASPKMVAKAWPEEYRKIIRQYVAGE